MIVRDLRVVGLIVALVVALVAIQRASPSRWPWAGAVPVLVSLAWGATAAPIDPAGGSCTDPLSPFAVWRFLEAALALGAAIVLGVLLRSGRGEVGLGRPTGAVVGLALAALLLAGPLAIFAGAELARPFFGDVAFRVEPAALVPATVFAVSNGVMEEVVYRGLLQAGLARVVGLRAAVVLQAIVFGLAHAAGPDVAGGGWFLFLAMTAGGLVAGAIAWRTRSLAIPIAAHVGFDLPIYLAFACPA
jgi:membrane protease YdiL (CAAX protease family)